MYPLKKKAKKRTEQKIQNAIVKMLKYRGWFVKRIIGNALQSGMPDLFACHSSYGMRLIEVKDPNRKGDVFTAAQHINFPKITDNGGIIHVLVAATEEEYQKLFGPSNWVFYTSIWKNRRTK